MKAKDLDEIVKEDVKQIKLIRDIYARPRVILEKEARGFIATENLIRKFQTLVEFRKQYYLRELPLTEARGQFLAVVEGCFCALKPEDFVYEDNQDNDIIMLPEY